MKYLVLVIEAALLVGLVVGIDHLGLLIFGGTHPTWFATSTDSYLGYFAGMIVGAIALGGTVHRQHD